MKIIVIVISILTSVTCLFFALLQHWYLSYMKDTHIRASDHKYTPVFDDMIISEERFPQKLNCCSQAVESKILTSLDKALQLSITGFHYIFLRPPIQSVNVPMMETEVQNTLQAALMFKMMGKTKKARKLFEHAASLAPDNPDVLTHYGEFLEQLRNDVLTADELYFKALVSCPTHQAALMNRKRTAELVDKHDLEIFRNIDMKRDMLKSIQERNPAFEAVKKQAFYLHVYHTVGIEGNTMTLEETRYLLETGRAINGKSIGEHNEILGIRLAMRYVKILTGFPSIEVKEILEIHRRVLGHADPLNCGVFRDKQVFVGSHIPPPPEQLEALMQGYVEWLNSEEAHDMHPVRYAAIAHYKLVDIHPFSDGNGRTSRLIMNLILLRAGYPPVMIIKEQRQRYYDYLNQANKGDIRPFVRFIMYCTDRMLEAYLWTAEAFGRGIANLHPAIEGKNEEI